MHFEHTSTLAWILVALQLTGLLSALLTRLTEGCCYRRGFQWLFLALLALIGGSTMFAIQLGSFSWLASGTTLAVMVVAGVWDCGRRQSIAVW
jgi:hypothetical protein